MRFLYLPLGFKANTNEWFYLYYTSFLKSNTSWVKLKYYVFSFSNMYWLVGHKSLSSVPNTNSLAFYLPADVARGE